MRHLEAAFTGNNQIWRHIVMLGIIIISLQVVGVIPFAVVIFLAELGGGAQAQSGFNPLDFESYGIDPVFGLTLLLFPFLLTFVVFFLTIKPVHGRSFIETINGRSFFRWSRFMAGAAVWMMLSAIYLFLSVATTPDNFEINNLSSTLIPLVIVTILLVPFQSGIEEVLFRGYYMQVFYRMVPAKWFPLIVTSLIFALVHAMNPEVIEHGFFTMMPHYLLFGLIFGIVTILDDGAEVAMGGHIANNSFIAVMITHESSVLQTPAVFRQLTVSPDRSFIMLLVMGVLYILLLALLFRWRISDLYSGRRSETRSA